MTLPNCFKAVFYEVGKQLYELTCTESATPPEEETNDLYPSTRNFNIQHPAIRPKMERFFFSYANLKKGEQ